MREPILEVIHNIGITIVLVTGAAFLFARMAGCMEVHEAELTKRNLAKYEVCKTLHCLE